MVDFGAILNQKLDENQLFCWEFCKLQQDTIYHHQDHDQVDIRKKGVFVYMVVPSEENNPGSLELVQRLTFRLKFDKSLFISIISFFTMLSKKNETQKISQVHSLI